MKLTVKQIKDIINSYNDNQELDFVGLEDIVIITKESILIPKKKVDEQPRGLGDDIFYHEPLTTITNQPNIPPLPCNMCLPADIMKLLDWKNDKSTRAKLEAFANTLIQVWNPNNGLLNLDHKKLNGTTLSRALFITKTQGKRINPKDRTFNIDEIIDKIIIFNLPYLKQKYYTNNN